MKRKILLSIISLLIFLSINSCCTKLYTIILPEEVAKPALVLLQEDGTTTLVEDSPPLIEPFFYIIQNASTLSDFRHNYLVMMQYSLRLQDYIHQIQDQENK
jgi:hypothetical protein